METILTAQQLTEYKRQAEQLYLKHKPVGKYSWWALCEKEFSELIENDDDYDEISWYVCDKYRIGL